MEKLRRRHVRDDAQELMARAVARVFEDPERAADVAGLLDATVIGSTFGQSILIPVPDVDEARTSVAGIRGLQIALPDAVGIPTPQVLSRTRCFCAVVRRRSVLLTDNGSKTNSRTGRSLGVRPPFQSGWALDQIVDANAACSSHRTMDCFTPVGIFVHQISLDIADRPTAEMDDETFGRIKSFGKRTVVLFHRGQIGWFSPPTGDVRLVEPGCEAWQVARLERHEN